MAVDLVKESEENIKYCFNKIRELLTYDEELLNFLNELWDTREVDEGKSVVYMRDAHLGIVKDLPVKLLLFESRVETAYSYLNQLFSENRRLIKKYNDLLKNERGLFKTAAEDLEEQKNLVDAPLEKDFEDIDETETIMDDTTE
ncbi:MAG TPA: hypothetical protein VJN02_12930 [Gammaproteobacteria bacterium]|nr:hypothetical protein [Gammaproteobacteria bacterium]